MPIFLDVNQCVRCGLRIASRRAGACSWRRIGAEDRFISGPVGRRDLASSADRRSMRPSDDSNCPTACD